MSADQFRSLSMGVMAVVTVLHLITLVLAGRRTASPEAVARARLAYKAALGVSFVGVACIIATQVARAWEVLHPPFQTIFEIFLYGSLCMAICYLIVAFVNRLHDGGRGGLVVGSSLGVLGFGTIVAVLGPVMTSYGNDRLELPPALQSAFFLPHVMVYIFGYGSSIVAALSAVVYLVLHYTRLGERFGGEEIILHLDTFAYRNVAISFPFLTIGLSLGTAWAWYAWANYWGWDNKEVWALITWLVFLIYLHLRLVGGWRGPRSSWFIVLGGLAVIFTLLLFGYLPASYFSEHKYAF